MIPKIFRIAVTLFVSFVFILASLALFELTSSPVIDYVESDSNYTKSVENISEDSSPFPLKEMYSIKNHLNFLKWFFMLLGVIGVFASLNLSSKT
ncbi:hypothetical protein ACFLQI_00290 [Candidatus Undinarchaeota archaeon]